MRINISLLAVVIMITSAAGQSQEKPPENKPALPKIEFEGKTYVLGNIGGEPEIEIFNEFFPEGVKPKEAKKFLTLHYYKNLTDPKKVVGGLISSLKEKKVPFERMLSPNPNLEGVNFFLTGPKGELEYNLFYYIKVANIQGLFAKQLVVKGEGDARDFQKITKKNSLPWLTEMAKAKFPRIIPPKGMSPPAAAGPDLSILPNLEVKEESFGDVDILGIKIQGLIIGSNILVDEAFAKKWENNPPSTAFSVTVPKSKQIRSIPGGKKTGLPELLKIQVASEDGKRVVEIARFTELKVPLQKDPKDRLKLCAWVLHNQGLKMAFGGKKNTKVFETYVTKIGKEDAVVINGQFEEQDGSAKFFMKLAAILDPNGEGGVMIYVIADSETSSVRSPDDLRSKGIGQRIVHSLRFVE